MGPIILFLLFVIVVSGVAGVRKFKKISKTQGDILNSPRFKAIADHIFEGGRHPSRIVITFSSEIFYGPVEGKFLQVPGNLVPAMDADQRHSLGGALQTEYGYSFGLCNSGQKSGFGASPADTGNEYIDSHADVLLISAGSNVAGW